MLGTKNKFICESELLFKLKENSDFLHKESIKNNAASIIELCRKNKKDRTMLDAFLNEYGLDNQEGVALMCLAESVLRIPDKKTRDLIISEKLSEGKWFDHLNQADSLFVNASTWGLLLAGKVVNTPSEWSKDPKNFLSSLISKSGEMPIRNAVLTAMQILSQEFVIGRDFEDIKKLSNIEKDVFSFDMLGEAARTESQAKSYFNSYMNAIEEVGKLNLINSLSNGVSIKLSALHPRYEMRKIDDLESQLIPKLLELVNYAHDKNVEITIDAEEQDRLSISLHIIKKLAFEKKIKDWPGFGLALQAYGKRSHDVIFWMNSILKKREMMHLRLVKGAYWDYEIKHAQVNGYQGYPVFSKKSLTDISFLSCAKHILQNNKIYAKFATHNAHTIASINHLAKDNNYEFQRLFGMGELLYQSAEKVLKINKKPSIYAPIGNYKDLLPYLVRRLLENGANSSFINRLLDSDTDSYWLAENPLLRLEKESKDIPLPSKIFKDRKNSSGFDFSEQNNLSILKSKLQSFEGKKTKAESIYCGRDDHASSKKDVISISNNTNIGTVTFDNLEKIKISLENFNDSKWSKYDVNKRSKILNIIADEIEKDPYEILYLLVNEAGKTIKNAVDEIREAIDFLRYYSNQIGQINTKINLSGPTGEENNFAYNERGRFLCISPWNFPVAILIGQISAALACGNNVIVKPSEHTSLLGYIVVKKFHDFGVPAEALKLVLGDGSCGNLLTTIKPLNGVAFTGSLETAKKIQLSLIQNQPEILPLIAETGGINTMIVDSSALLEQVTDDVVRSAFDSAGQRCSALRILCIQEEIYDDLLNMIKGNISVQNIGNPNNFSTDIGPVINQQALYKLNNYIEICKKNNMNVFQIKNNFKQTHMSPTIVEIDNIADVGSEQFGPILHVLKFKYSDMKNLIEQINNSGYGLTMGIHSRIESRADNISHNSNVGNIYINRDIVGAVVGSQPFGGVGLSGSGFKAGGPNYLLQFLNEKVISKNSVAFGGNAELLNMQDDL